MIFIYKNNYKNNFIYRSNFAFDTHPSTSVEFYFILVWHEKQWL